MLAFKLSTEKKLLTLVLNLYSTATSYNAYLFYQLINLSNFFVENALLYEFALGCVWKQARQIHI
mgnify:CR=1 FL=1